MEITCQNCGLVDDYETRTAGPHTSAYCNGCGRYIKHLPKPDKEVVIYFGKFKGTALKDFKTKEHVSWLNWAVKNAIQLKPAVIEAILKHLNNGL